MFDSSWFMSFDRDPGMRSMLGQFGMAVPLDDDYDSQRRQHWASFVASWLRAFAVSWRYVAAASVPIIRLAPYGVSRRSIASSPAARIHSRISGSV